jgi:multifunctional methyltransferase subunit TRM112
MRLLTHNLLQCHVRGCNTKNYPLRFEDAQIMTEESEMNPDFLVRMLSKIDWTVLRGTALQLGITTLPETVPDQPDEDEAFLQALHHVLMETRVVNGKLICDGCGHIYRIKDGIANMLLSEHEV